MGQYHKTVNLDKKQFLNPHKLGDGLKLLEQCGWSPGGTNDALHLLLACTSGRGGGDFQSKSTWVGAWAGDRIAVVGDYAEKGDLADFDATEVYEGCCEGGGYEDITDEIIPILEAEYELVYAGDGWCDRVQLSDIKDYRHSHGRGDRTIVIGPEDDEQGYLSSQVREAIKRFKSEPGNRETEMTVENLGLVACVR